MLFVYILVEHSTHDEVYNGILRNCRCGMYKCLSGDGMACVNDNDDDDSVLELFPSTPKKKQTNKILNYLFNK